MVFAAFTQVKFNKSSADFKIYYGMASVLLNSQQRRNLYSSLIAHNYT